MKLGQIYGAQIHRPRTIVFDTPQRIGRLARLRMLSLECLRTFARFLPILITAIILTILLNACTKHPTPGPALEKVNGVPTANADDADARGEDNRAWDEMAYAPKMPVVYFDWNSSVVRMEYIEEIGYAAMATNVDWVCQVDGHASEEGATDYNLALGHRRARAVASYLQAFRGINTKETSYGEERPAATRELSRRVEIECR